MIDITNNVREVIKTIQRIPKDLENATLPALSNAAKEIHRIMSREGLPVTYPINWDSIKQKIFVIAKLREENNLPYKRTGAHAQGWESGDVAGGSFVQNIGHQAVFLYGSPSGEFPAAQHVLPTGQSHIHENRWRLVRPVVDAVFSKLPKSILDKISIHVNQ